MPYPWLFYRLLTFDFCYCDLDLWALVKLWDHLFHRNKFCHLVSRVRVWSDILESFIDRWDMTLLLTFNCSIFAYILSGDETSNSVLKNYKLDFVLLSRNLPVVASGCRPAHTVTHHLVGKPLFSLLLRSGMFLFPVYNLLLFAITLTLG